MEENESVDPPVPPPPAPDSASVFGAEAITNAAALPMDIDSNDIDEEEESSDGNWSSGSSFNDDSDDESILTYDTADDESINFVRPAGGMCDWGTVDSDREPYVRPGEEGSWRMDPEESFSDYILIVVSDETGEERTYHVHKFVLAHGSFCCDYFSALFRTPCCENEKGTSRFSFPAEVAKFFPDFLDILYHPGHVENISFNHWEFSGRLYGCNLLPLRALSFYFGCRKLSHRIKLIMEGDICGINDASHETVALHKTTKYIELLCGDDGAEDSEELLNLIIDRLVQCFDHFGSKEKEKEMGLIVMSMTPDLILKLLLQATTTFTNRYRILVSKSSEPFSKLIVAYLNESLCITTWQFERIVLCLLDLLQPSAVAMINLADALTLLAEKNGMHTSLVKRAIIAYLVPPEETIEKINEIKRRQECIRNSVEDTQIIIEGSNRGESDFDLNFLGLRADGHQGYPDAIVVHTISGLTVAEVKALVYGRVGLRTELQRLEYKNEDGDFFLAEDDDNLESIFLAARTGRTLYLQSVPFCPLQLTDRRN